MISVVQSGYVTLQPAKTALVLIDLMPRIIDLSLAPYDGKAVLAKSLELAEAFRAKGAAVIAVRVERPNVDEQPAGSELEPAVAELSDVVVVKRSWGAFGTSNLQEVLQERGIQAIVMAGIATNMGVESTARHADDLGYAMFFAEDAMSGMDGDAHRFAIDYVFTKLGTVASTEELISMLG